MKELEQGRRDDIRQEQQQPTERRLTTLVLHKGHTLYEINLTTKEIWKATVEERVVEMGRKGQHKVRVKVVVKPHCVYIGALNKENADMKGVELMVEKGIIQRAAGLRLLAAMRLQQKENRHKKRST